MKKITPRNLFIVIVAVVILAIPTATKGGAQTVAFPDTKFAVISDTHYYDPSLGTSGSAYQNYIGTERKLIADSAEIVDFSIDRIASSGVKFVLVTGDLSKDGELVDHQRMAANLSRLRKNGIKVYVIPGNHDINNPRSFRYNGGKAERVANITAEQFAKIYNDFGYGDAVMRDQSSLSYVAEPQKGLWIVALDSCRYGENEDGCAAQCGGEISGEKLAFLKKVLGRARSEHKAVIVMLHHGIVEHWNGQSKFNPNYLLDDCQSVGRLLASYGVRVAFTGHYHTQDISKADFGKDGQLYDIETGSLITPPCAIRYCEISNNTLTVRTDSVLSKIRPGTDFEHKSVDFIRKVMYNAYASKMRKYGIPNTDTEYIAGAMADAAMAHYFGDEDPSKRAAFDENRLSPKGREAYSEIKYVIDGFWNDLEPQDNSCAIDLIS